MSSVPNDIPSSSLFTLTKHVNPVEQTESNLTQTVETIYRQPSTLPNMTSMSESVNKDLPMVSEFEQPTNSITTKINPINSSELDGDMSNETSNFGNNNDDVDTKEVDIDTQDLLSVFEKPHEDRKLSRRARDFVEVGRFSAGYENEFTYAFSLV
ncbi:hypothetical protein M231_01190 [Tremella mesenterica]|uniref:Uncharacterized protein n=1 Tax=Tremella mesenterica TaxID=5217 RepID=A0A4Q1BU36_TREME|nr:hypothetical protein M231_01190 [Tremella mesenterica]